MALQREHVVALLFGVVLGWLGVHLLLPDAHSLQPKRIYPSRYEIGAGSSFAPPIPREASFEDGSNASLFAECVERVESASTTVDDIVLAVLTTAKRHELIETLREHGCWTPRLCCSPMRPVWYAAAPTPAAGALAICHGRVSDCRGTPPGGCARCCAAVPPGQGRRVRGRPRLRRGGPRRARAVLRQPDVVGRVQVDHHGGRRRARLDGEPRGLPQHVRPGDAALVLGARLYPGVRADRARRCRE